MKFTAVTFAHGVRKIFFHAGTCGTINSPDAGGVLFEYGGAPRKMYAGVATLTKLLGVPDECVKIVKRDDMVAYIFRALGKLETALSDALRPFWSDPARTLSLVGPGWLHSEANVS